MTIIRRVNFMGTDAAYIQFLEDHYFHLQRLQASSGALRAGRRIGTHQSNTSAPAEHLSHFETNASSSSTNSQSSSHQLTFISHNTSRQRIETRSESQQLKQAKQSIDRMPNFGLHSLYDTEKRLHIIGDILPFISPPGQLNDIQKLRALAGVKKGNFEFKSFKDLVVDSLCKVLFDNGHQESVYEIMTEYHGTSDKKYIQALLRGAKWANKLIYALSKEAFCSRNWDECFILAQLTMPLCKNLAETVRSKDEVLRLLKAKATSPREVLDCSPSASPPLLIPLILSRYLESKDITMEKICHSLHYELPFVKSHQNQFDSYTSHFSNFSSVSSPYGISTCRTAGYMEAAGLESLSPGVSSCMFDRGDAVSKSPGFTDMPDLSYTIPNLDEYITDGTMDFTSISIEGDEALAVGMTDSFSGLPVHKTHNDIVFANCRLPTRRGFQHDTAYLSLSHFRFDR